jgi:hypothetical protein
MSLLLAARLLAAGLLLAYAEISEGFEDWEWGKG